MRSVLIALMLMLASCQVIGGGGGDNNTNGNSGGSGDQPVIVWDRSPAHVVFRAEVTGGENADALFVRNEVPLCSIYGDGRIVWVSEGRRGQEILFDTLTDSRIRQFVETLTLQEQIYSFDAKADLQIPTEEDPVVEQLTISVNDLTHVTDSFSDWDLDYFQQIVDTCQTWSQTPTIFLPQAAWVSAEQVEYNGSLPFIAWDERGSGLDLMTLAESGERKWIDNTRLVQVLWLALRENQMNMQFGQGEGIYNIAIEVPNVTAQSPAAPEK